MKKYLALIVGLLLVLGFTASAFAVDEPVVTDQPAVSKGAKVTLGGELRVRGWYLKNASGDRRAISGPMDGGSQGWYDQRVRLNLNAEVTKNTSGYVEYETGSSTTGDTNTWGSTGGGGINSKQSGTAYFREAYILHKGSGLLGIPAGLKIGHMALALGEKQFLDHTKFGDDAIVVFMDPTKELHLGVLTTKFSEGTTATDSAADINGYVVVATYKVDKSLFGLNYSYVAIQNTPDYSFQNLGIHANGSAAGLLYQFEFDKQFGKQSTTVKYKGYGVLLGAGYKVDPITIRAQYARGSGDKNSTDNNNKEFQVTSGNDIHFTQIYEYTTRTSAANQGLANSGGRSSGIANLTYYRLGLDVAPMKDLTASVDAFMLNATEANTGTGSKKIGNEYDAKVAYKIDKNLTYSVMAGYFKPGKAWENGNVGAAITTGNKKAITQAMHALTLSF